MGDFDPRYEEGYTLSVEKEVDKIRADALELVRKTHPEIPCAIDSRSIADYSEKIWEYPGKWYLSFKLPDGFRSRVDLVRTIAEETVRYFSGRRSARQKETGMQRAKELFLKYCGSRFHMDREGDGSEYESYGVTRETEETWAKEYISSFLESGLRGKEALRSYLAAEELLRYDKDREYLDACLYYPLRAGQLDDVTVLFMLDAAFRTAESAVKKGRFSCEEAEAYQKELAGYTGEVCRRAADGTLTRSDDYVMGEFSDPVYIEGYLRKLEEKWKEIYR